MTSIDQLRPGKRAPTPVTLLTVDDPGIALEVYREVGRPFGWRQKDWTVRDMVEHLSDRNITVWLIRSGTTIGFLQIDVQPECTAQIATFGLLPEFTDKGFGGEALTVAVRQAWSMQPLDGERIKRDWLRTTTNDHPHALPNYLARGFRVYKTEPVDS